jgi:hypothetical protein
MARGLIIYCGKPPATRGRRARGSGPRHGPLHNAYPGRPPSWLASGNVNSPLSPEDTPPTPQCPKKRSGPPPAALPPSLAPMHKDYLGDGRAADPHQTKFWRRTSELVCGDSTRATTTATATGGRHRFDRRTSATSGGGSLSFLSPLQTPLFSSSFVSHPHTHAIRTRADPPSPPSDTPRAPFSNRQTTHVSLIAPPQTNGNKKKKEEHPRARTERERARSDPRISTTTTAPRNSSSNSTQRPEWRGG